MPKLRWWQWGLAGMVGLYVIGSLASPPNTATKDSPTSVPSPEIRELREGDYFAVVIDQRQDPKSLPTLARELCGAQQFCSVSAWTDPARAARGFPFTEREAAAVVFSYSVNRTNGAETIHWDCNVWSGIVKSACLAH